MFCWTGKHLENKSLPETNLVARPVYLMNHPKLINYINYKTVKYHNINSVVIFCSNMYKNNNTWKFLVQNYFELYFER